MSDGTILITGGSGFLGVSVAARILAKNPEQRIVLADLVQNPRIKPIADKTHFVKANITDARECDELLTPEVDTVYHFAALVSAGAERDFAAGLHANVYATLYLLESCRKQGRCPRFIFPSSIATFGGTRLPKVVDDWTHQHPQNSYGVSKVLGEQLLNDYSRKGFIDGRGVRLPAIVVRDEPNPAASEYASALIREPIAGRDYVCPVGPDTRIPILSLRQAVEVLIALSELPEGSLGDYRTINGVSINPSAGEIADAVRRCGAPDMGTITFDANPLIASIVASWPKGMRFDRARALGLKPDASIEAVIDDYLRQKGMFTKRR
jgi:nucleoside-diphosphate-sugar epimerase